MARMKKAQWMEHHGFTTEEMEKIETLLKLFNGKITKILDKQKES